MSLSDTAFIFVLALIIFGPKKLPEIGRQLGRLVGEFRRASNEFKFQIEEELRQAELSDRQTTSAPSNTADSSIPESYSTPALIDPATASDDSTASDLTYPEETLPVGQHPSMDHQDPYELNDLNRNLAESESAEAIQEGEASADTIPTIRAAAGSQPRTALPYAGAEPTVSTSTETITPADGDVPEPGSSAPVASIPPAANETPASGHEPADPYAVSTVADVTHG